MLIVVRQVVVELLVGVAELEVVVMAAAAAAGRASSPSQSLDMERVTVPFIYNRGKRPLASQSEGEKVRVKRGGSGGGVERGRGGG